MKMTTGQQIVWILLGLSLIAGTVSGAQIYYRLAYLWGILLGGSWLWSFLSLRGMLLRRTARALRAQVGQIFEERYDIDNPGRMPRVWLTIRDESPLPGSQGSRVYPLVEGRRGRSYVARTRLTQRGVFPLGPTILESGDPFGLFPVSRTMPAEDSLLVFPMLFDVRTFPSPPGVMPGGEALRRRTPQITPNAAGVREYGPGDPLSRIHWLSSARRDRLMSKEFELDPQAEVWIFLDAMADVQSFVPYTPPMIEVENLRRMSSQIFLPPSTEEYAVSIAASLARYYLRQDRAVGFASAGQSVSVLPPDRSGRQLSKILEALAILRAEGDLPLRGLVEIQAQHLSRGSTVVFITPSMHEDVALAADYLLRRGLRPVAVLLDSASFNGPTGTDQVVAMLNYLHIPVRKVKNGDDLEAALAETLTQPVWQG